MTNHEMGPSNDKLQTIYNQINYIIANTNPGDERFKALNDFRDENPDYFEEINARIASLFHTDNIGQKEKSDPEWN